jgi:hypothetical protein
VIRLTTRSRWFSKKRVSSIWPRCQRLGLGLLAAVAAGLGDRLTGLLAGACRSGEPTLAVVVRAAAAAAAPPAAAAASPAWPGRGDRAGDVLDVVEPGGVTGFLVVEADRDELPCRRRPSR